MTKSLKLLSITGLAFVLAACNGGLKPEKKEEILSSPVLNGEQLEKALTGKAFSANILSGSNTGQYTFKFAEDGTLYISKSQYSGTRQWSIKNNELCVKTCHQYYQDTATGILYGTTNGKISSIFTPK